MIIEFNIGNFKSFKEIVTFSMVASKTSSRDKNLDENNTFNIDSKLALLKSAVIYGANASGKSNLIDAMRFMREGVRDSARDTQAGDAIRVEVFRLSEDTVNEPSFVQMVFVLDGKKYRYGFEVNQKQVVSEWLFHVPNTKEAKLFVRDENGISVSSAFKEGKGIEDKTRDNALFLSVVAQFNGSISKKILGWFKMIRIYSGLHPRINHYEYTASLLENSRYRESVLQLLRKLDLGFETVEIEKTSLDIVFLPEAENIPDELKGVHAKLKDAMQELKTIRNFDSLNRKAIKTIHQRYNSEGQASSTELFDLESNESEGTRKLFALAGSLVDVLSNGKILVIDEFDRSLHPLITQAIIKLFNSNDTNPKNAQIIFTTHDTNMLTNKLFRRDQIWFTEKDKCRATKLYSLVEYKVRNDASFESDYIQGRYGAIPFIGDLDRLIGEPDAE